MKRAVVGCAITLSTLQHASLLLSIELSSSSSSSTPSPSSARSAASPLSLAVVLLLASTAVSVGTLGFLARTRRVWPSVLAFACHIDVLALTLALNYGIASEFFTWYFPYPFKISVHFISLLSVSSAVCLFVISMLLDPTELLLCCSLSCKGWPVLLFSVWFTVKIWLFSWAHFCTNSMLCGCIVALVPSITISIGGITTTTHFHYPLQHLFFRFALSSVELPST
jgi:hypothetical protein